MNRRLLWAISALAITAVVAMPAGSLGADASDDDASGPLNTLTEAEKAAGWKLLFDGKSTSGWRNYKKNDISPGWTIIDSALSAKDYSAGDIITTDQFGNFELSLEYKISKGGNSGVMFRVTEEGEQPYQTGPEVQIYDHPGGPGVQKTGWLYQLYSSEVDSTKPAGQWNRMRLIVTPEKCETHVNGVKYYEYVIGNDDWNKRVAQGKFSEWPLFAKRDRGHICLQAHGGKVAFRNIKIRPIDAK